MILRFLLPIGGLGVAVACCAISASATAGGRLFHCWKTSTTLIIL